MVGFEFNQSKFKLLKYLDGILSLSVFEEFTWNWVWTIVFRPCPWQIAPLALLSSQPCVNLEFLFPYRADAVLFEHCNYLTINHNVWRIKQLSPKKNHYYGKNFYTCICYISFKQLHQLLLKLLEKVTLNKVINFSHIKFYNYIKL